MRVAVNGKAFGVVAPGGAVRAGIEIVRHLARAAPDLRLDVHVPGGAASPAAAPAFDEANVTVHRHCYPGRSDPVRQALWEQWRLPRIVRADRADLLLNLTNSAPVLLPMRTPQVLLLHDVAFRNPQWVSRGFRVYLDWVMRTAARRRLTITTVSETSAAEIGAATAGRVRAAVIPNGGDLPPEGIVPLRRPRPYVLFLGSLNPRKNLAGAIAGFRVFRQTGGFDHDLLVAGGGKRIFADGAAVAADEAVVPLGYVDEPGKWAALAGASALLLPSHHEGFGLPVLEAMRLGVPAVISDIPVFRELFDGAAMFVDPQDASAIAGGLHRVLGDPAEAHRLGELGRRRAGAFGWERTGAAYADLVRTIGTAGRSEAGT